MSTKECRSVSTKSDLSERECELISPIIFSEEGRPLSPDSFSSVNEHIPLSPDSPIPSFSPVCELYTSLGYHSESLESDLSDREDILISPTRTLFDNRPPSPDSASSLNIPGPPSPDLILPEYKKKGTDCDILLHVNEISSFQIESSNILTSEAERKLLQSHYFRQQSPETLETDNRLNKCDLEGLLLPDSTKPLSKQIAIMESEKTSNEYASENITKPLTLSAKVPAKKCQKTKLSKNAKHKEGNAHLTDQVESTLTHRLNSPKDCKLSTSLKGADDQTLTTEPCDSLSSHESKAIGLSEARPIQIQNQFNLEKTSIKESEIAATKRNAHNFISKVNDPQYKGKTFCTNHGDFEYIVKTDENRQLSPDSPIQQFRSFFPESSLQISGHRSCSPESIYSNSIETESFAGDLLNVEQRPESPDSFQSELESRPLSPDSIPEYRPISSESIILVSDIRGSSPDSVSACRPLSPDSPIPQYSVMFCELLPVAGCRSSSLESLASGSDCELNNLSFISSDCRTSPQSIASLATDECLPQDSPIPDFRSLFPEHALPVSGYRSCSPESIYSNSIEHDLFPGDLFDVEQRPESPDSVQSEFEARPLSPDSIPEYRPMSPESMILASHFRGSSPDSISSCRSLSPDSPIPQYSTMFFELLPVAGCRSSSLESLASSSDCELNNLSSISSDCRSSLQSIASLATNECLSQDSPIPDFRSLFPEHALPVSGYRSCSPESVCSNAIEHDLFPGDLFDVEQRPESPDSVQSEFEARPLSPDSIPEYRPMSPESMILASHFRRSSPDSISSCRSLSPDSPIPQYSTMFFELLPVAGCRSSSLESLASSSDCELNNLSSISSDCRSSLQSIASLATNECLSQDSPIPDFRSLFSEHALPVSGYRSCSPESVCSNAIEHDLFPGDLFDVEQRPESPDSVQSEFEARPLSPDSIPEYRPMSPESMILASHFRRSSPDSISSCRSLSPDSPIPQYSTMLVDVVLVTGCRLSSPDSMASDNDYEVNILSTADSDHRPSSPESMASIDENTQLSPDSPIPAFRPYFFESVLPFPECRSCSPESICSNSIEYEQMSPEYVISVIDMRSVSPDSVSSCRPLSPDSPVPQYSTMLAELLTVKGPRSPSPESMASDEDYQFNVLTVADSDHRPSSPDSIASVDENTRLAPDSPIQAFTPSFSESALPISGHGSCSPESVCSNSLEYELFAMSPQSLISASEIRGSSPDSVSACRPLSPDSPIPQYSGLFCELMPAIGHRPSSPESLAADKNYDDDDDDNELNADHVTVSRASSPDSMKSADENRPLSPDSPIQQFRPFFPESSLPVSGYRSCSPESIYSNSIEHDLFPGDLFDVEQRPESPDSVQSEFEARPLSPDSIPEYRPMSPESMILASHFRGSSPDSISSCRSLSPDSPIPQYSTMLVDVVLVTGCRVSSPDSMASDNDYEVSILSTADSDHRPSSPESMASIDENTQLSPDSPIPAFRPYFFESVLPFPECRSCSPESICSNSIEYEQMSPEYVISVIDTRSVSPDSVSSCRPLSPDSPVPQYSTTLAELLTVTGPTSPSPESMASDEDDQFNVLTVADSDHRPSSPDSIASVDENTRLAPDSPIQAFTPSFSECALPISGHGSCSPESVCSNSIEYELFAMSPQSLISASDIRVSSPDSVSACRPLSPDSPIPQYSTMLVDLVSVTGHRSSSPESMTSDEDYEFNVYTVVPSDYRPASPDSVVSADENGPLSPDSPIPEFQSLLFDSTWPVCGYKTHSPESVHSETIECKGLEGDIFTAEQRRVSVDSSGTTSYAQFQETIKLMPEYKLVYKAIPLNLISHIHDPHYKGEMFSPKTGLFEYTGCRMKIVQTCKMDESNSITGQGGYKIPALNHETSQISKQVHNISTLPLSENQTALSDLSLTQSRKYARESFEFPEENSTDSISQYTSEGYEYLEISDDLRASSPESIRSINEFRSLTPDSPIPEHMPYTMIFQYESRPPSPESVSSVNEFQRLSPDSPIPEFLSASPIPYEHNVQFRQLSPIMSDLQKCDITWMSSEYASLWPETKQRPVSPGSELSECDSRSLSSPIFSFESACRSPSPEALRELEPIVSITPDSLIFDIDCRPESPESVTSQTQCKDSTPDNTSHWASDVALFPIMTDEQCRPDAKVVSESDFATSAQNQKNFNYVLNSGRKTLPCWHEFVLEPEQEEKISETREAPPLEMNKVKKMSSGDGDGRSILSIQGDLQKIKAVKQELELQPKQGPEESSDSPTSEIGQEEFKTRALQAKVSEKDIQSKKQNLEIKNKNTSGSEVDSSQVQNQSTNVTILEQKAIASSLASEGNIQPGVSDPNSLHCIPEGRTVGSTDLDNVCPMTSLKQSFEQPKETSGLCQIHTTPFHFSQQSHRTVTPNLIISSSPSSDVISASERTPFLGSSVLPTDLGSVTPASSELCSNQEPSTFHHVISEFEKTVSARSTDDPKSVSNQICPMETALAPSSSEISQPTAERLTDFDLKAKPTPVQADSLDSDTEFFDCPQTFLDISEPELRSEELFDSEAVYHVEESPSLPNTPAYDNLLATSKITEKSELDSQESPRPVSWGSEEIDLPIVLEPEDECIGEHDEEIAYPYGYADEHSYAEELPPRQGGQYDDDDSLGREIAEELGLLSDSSEEEVLTTRVVRRRVIIQGDEFPEIPPHRVTEEQYIDEHGNIVIKKITRKIIRKYVSADGVEREEVMVEGAQQEAITVDDADDFSKVVKRTVVRTAGDQTEVTFSEAVPAGEATASEFEGENVQGRKVSKVIKTMVVQGERMEKQIGDPSLSADLPSAKEDFEKDPHA
ncbi:ankyrin-2b isoform X2 [Neoarius graeffei]|uniref:ankyrin-2b isoform X2 n=1 Tax=Neoarius graeffei TaxID=443677 RepID=UPI00298D4210|nr:ankyrin-2b isoform X2 [Neoarius graeffei]